jgi:hypothetical protein
LTKAGVLTTLRRLFAFSQISECNGMFHQLSEGALQKMLHTPGVTTSNK